MGVVAYATAWSRLCTPSFPRMFCTWLRTVAVLTCSRFATALVLSPSARSLKISSSLLVRSSLPSTGAADCAEKRSLTIFSNSLVAVTSRNRWIVSGPPEPLGVTMILTLSQIGRPAFVRVCMSKFWIGSPS